MKSKNQNNNIYKYISQSAGNETFYYGLGSSETTRALSDKNKEWLAGIIDGHGNFNLNSIWVQLSTQDSRILYHIKDLLKTGRIITVGNNLIMYIVSHREGMKKLVNTINGHIKIKVPEFINACQILDINYIPASPIIPQDSSYLAGLIDTDGSILLNNASNIVELHIELPLNEFTKNLDLSNVIDGAKPSVYQSKLESIRWIYSKMLPIYNYIKKNRCYSDMKYYRAMQIKNFLEIRKYKNYAEGTKEKKLYENWIKKNNLIKI